MTDNNTPTNAAPAPAADLGLPAESLATADAAGAHLTALMKTPEWGAAFLKGDAKARAQHDALQAIKAGIVRPGASPSEAQGAAYLHQVKTSDELSAKFAAGDPETVAKVHAAVQMQAEGAGKEDAAIEEGASPPAKPEDYDMGPMEKPTPELQRIDGALRNFLYDARVPRAIGNGIVESAGRALKNFQQMKPGGWGAMDDNMRANHGEAVKAQLRGLWHGDFDKNLQAAHGLTDELDRRNGGRVYAFLEMTGLGSDVNFIVAVAQHAERLALRKERRGRK